MIVIVLGLNDMSTLVGHFVSSPREREKTDRRVSRGDKSEGQGRKRNRRNRNIPLLHPDREWVHFQGKKLYKIVFASLLKRANSKMD